MKPSLRNLSLVFATAMPLTFGGATFAASVTYDADPTTTGAQDGSGSGWNATDANQWNGSANILWPNTTADDITFGAGSSAPGAVTVGTVMTNKITFAAVASGSYSLMGGTITLGGTTPTLAVNSDATIGSVIAGTAGLTKTGTSKLTLSGANTYTGATSITGGSVAFGSGGSTGGGALALGTVAGSRAVLNMDSTGTLTHNTTVNVGGAGASANGAGAINQTAGTVNLMNSAGYLQLGNGGYGSYNISGGTLNFTNASGTRIGDNTGGLGSFVQTGGTVNMTRYFVVGGTSGTAPLGVATFTGGTLNGAGGFYLIVGNAGTATGILNVGTAAGGSATVVSKSANGISVGDQGTATGILNVNSGLIQFDAGGIRKGSAVAGSTGIVNLNGGTLKANAASLTLVNNTVTSANVYNGGLKVDTQAFETTISANLLTTTGSGIYPAGGVINLAAADGAGYIGAPLVAATSNGTGTGAMAVANVANGQVTGVTLTCPGQGYAAGDTVTFTFSGGGSTAAAAPFAYVLKAGDVAANGAGGLTKLGTGKLTLTGTNTFSGPIAVTGTLAADTLSLNNTTLIINGFNSTSPVPVQANTSLATGGTVAIVVNGTFSVGTWPLIYYPQGGSIGGSGFSALKLQTASLPRGVVATLVDNPLTGSVDLHVSASNPLSWKPGANGNWDINTTTNWTIGTSPQKYLDGDIVSFDDSVGVGTSTVVLNTSVVPLSVSFNNAIKNYTLSGTGAITGTTGVVKDNTGTVTVLNANTYTGTTIVNGGTLQFGNGTTNGSIASLLENHATVVFNPAGTAIHTGSISGDSAGTFVKSGSGTQIVTASTNTSSGIFQVNAGTLQFGNGTVNGATGSSALYQLASGTTLRLEQAAAAAPAWANITGAGNISLNSAQAVNGSANWGTLALTEGFTGVLRVENGRVNATNGSSGLGNTAKVQILAGAQFLAFTSATPYITPIEIAGTGWGETGYPGGLRLAGSATATWAGSVTLTADSGIMVQPGANFTVTGPIAGAYTCEFYAGSPTGDSGVLTIAPTAAVQNSYAATRINGSPNGSIVAGNPYAFSSGGLEVVGAILKLNGNNLSFANLSGAGGAIGNYSTTTPATLMVGSDNTSTSYAGVIRDGAAAPLALFKTGTGKLTLTAAQTYTGNTTVSQGTLAIASPTLADASTVSIATGAKLQLDTAASDTVGTLVLGGTTVPAGTYNASNATYGSYFVGTGSLVVGAGTAFDTWAASKGLDGTPGKEKGPTADPDKDGIANLPEFYLDGNPLVNDPSILPAGTMDATYLTLTFHRRDDAEADVATQAMQYGTTLTSWTSTPIGTGSSTGANGVIVTVAENGASPDTITVQIPRTLASTGKLFGRLQLVK